MERPVEVDVWVDSLVQARDAVVDDQYRHVGADLAAQVVIRVLAKVVLSREGFVDPGYVVPRGVKHAVAVVVVIDEGGVGVPGVASRVGIAVHQPVVHAVVVEHQGPALVGRLRIGYPSLSAIEVGVGEVDSGVGDRDHNALAGVAPFPGIIGAVDLAAAH